MIRNSIAVVVLALSSSVVLAQTSPPAQPQYNPLPRPETQPKPVPAAVTPGPKPHEIISALTTDINGDATPDRILLSQGPDGDATLWVYLGKSTNDGTQAFHAPMIGKDIVFAGTAFGQWPSLEMNKQGTSLLIRSQNESIGRSRWNQTLTIAWRNNTLVVAGLTYEWRDTLDLKQFGTCDANFLSGRALRNGKPHADKVAPLTLAQFDPRKLPKACTFD
jgi:hypothetical protein